MTKIPIYGKNTFQILFSRIQRNLEPWNIVWRIEDSNQIYANHDPNRPTPENANFEPLQFQHSVFYLLVVDNTYKKEIKKSWKF